MTDAIRLPAAALLDLGFLLQGTLNTAEVQPLLPELALQYPQILVLGHAGRCLWDQAPMQTEQGEDPLDDYCVRVAENYLDSVGVDERQILFPSDQLIDLRGLGRKLGWHYDSLIGTGIHPTYGSWFAYRAVIALPEVFEATVPLVSSSPCESCVDKPCLAACPVGATGSEFNLPVCSGYRLGNAECKSQCLARNACPVGSDFRYDSEQMRYHYEHSLKSLRLLNSRAFNAGD